MISREQFLACPKPAVEEIQVPSMGGSVYVKALSAGERDAFEVEHTKSGTKDFRARLAAACVCDADGASLFTKADVPALSALPASVIDPIVQAASKLNRLSDEDVDTLKKTS